jgi:TP901 family phage tail tape measure protein
MADKNLDIVIKLRDAASRGLKSIDRNITGLGKSATSATNGLKTMYASLAAIAGVLAGGALLGKSIKDFAAFDDNMRAAGAVTKATTEELKLMTQAAKDMGRETRYTAAQAAEALRFLGMAGLSATQATEALPDVLNLAAAGMLDLGTAADITTNVLSAFGLEVEDLSRVNDVLVQTFTNSNVNLTEIGEAFKIVGPIAKGVGSDFEDLVGTIGALGNAGIKGTLAGTALKNAIDALLIPTAKEKDLMAQLEGRLGGVALQIKDASGDFIGFEKILVQLEKAGLRGEEALQLFGMRAGPGMAALLNMGSEGLGELIEKLRESGGVSKEIAGQMEAGLGGEIRRSISLFESLKNTLGEAFGPKAIEFLKVFQDTLRDVIAVIEDLAQSGEIDTLGDMIITSFNAVNFVVAKTYRAFRLLGALIANMAALATGDIGIITEAVKGINEEFEKLTGTFKPDVVVGEITQEMYDELNKAAKPDGPIGKGAKEVGDTIASNIISYPSIQAQLKSALVRLNADLKLESEKIKGEYDQGLINLESYYDQRASIVTRKIEAELAILRELLAREDDVSKKSILAAQIYSKEEQLNLELLKLENEKVKAEDKLREDRLKKESKINDLKLKAEKAYQDQKDRVKEEGVTTLDAQFAKELADLQTKQNSELAVVKSYHEQLYQAKVEANASEAELERAKQEEMAAIRDQSAAQSEEKAQLIADQNLRLQEYKLNNLKTIANGTAQIFTQLYEMTGKKNKEFFYIAKAAAIAEATMNVAQGVTKAMAQGGVWGIAQGAIVAAAGAAQIATIASQGLAEGGEVLGHSPNDKADNIPAMLTANEYVHPVDSVKYYGKSIMEGIRTKSIPKSLFSGFAYGGYVKKGRSHFAEGGMVSGDGQNIGGGPNGGPGDINIINVTDPSQIDQYLSTSEGQDAVLNVLGARPEAAQRMLKGS